MQISLLSVILDLKVVRKNMNDIWKISYAHAHTQTRLRPVPESLETVHVLLKDGGVLCPRQASGAVERQRKRRGVS